MLLHELWQTYVVQDQYHRQNANFRSRSRCCPRNAAEQQHFLEIEVSVAYIAAQTTEIRRTQIGRNRFQKHPSKKLRRRTVQHQQENTMARLPFVEDNTESREVLAAFEAARRFNGRVANSMRLYAHSPAILKFLLPLQAVLQKDLGCKIDAKTRALAMIKVSALNECKY